MGRVAPAVVDKVQVSRGSPISKSAFLAGVQCKKLFWTRHHAPDLIPPPDADAQSTFEQGHGVGLLARQLFLGGIEVRSLHLAKAVAETNRLLELGRPLYEPAFIFGGCCCRADILAPVHGGGWDLIEVKSTTKTKDEHLTDLAFQTYVTKGAGITVRRCFVCRLNPNYVRHGDLDPRQLFVIEDVTAQVSALLDGVKKSIADLIDVLHSAEGPKVGIGPHCDDPHLCPLKKVCWSFLTDHNVLTLYRGGKKGWKLLADGITDVKDIPAEFPLTDQQQIQRRAVLTGELHVNEAAVHEFLRRLKYPISFLDFETFATAVPLFDDVRPYQQVPFQFSVHVQGSAGAEPEHFSFLANGTDDPRPAFMTRLRAVLPSTGSLVAFNSGFETQRLNECAAVLPEHQPWVQDVAQRTVDLLQPFRSFHYYHPDQKGSCSIKDVLPAVTGSGYEDLEIQSGTAASREFLRITFGKVSDDEKGIVRRRLEQYCGLDTLGMVRIVAELKRLSKV